MASKCYTLNNGHKIPIVGLGTYKSQTGEVERAIKDAVDCGYRHFDCAWFYGNEAEIGRAIKDKINEGVVKRADIFITSKLWNNFHAKNKVVPMLKETLSHLQVEYIDLFLVHWPFAFKEDAALWPLAEGKSAYSDIDYLETWEGMEECVNLGLAKSIGVSNFNSEQIDRLVQAATIKPVVNQVECNPNMNQKRLIQFCKERDVILTAYCPLGRSANAGTPGFPEPTIYDPKVVEMAKKFNKSPAQIVLNYLISLGVCVIPKSVTKSRIEENIKVFDFQLHDDDVAYLDSCNKDKRSPAGEVEQAIKDAIDCGYRHFDCAWFYGNEAEIGKALKEKINEGVIKREDIFITSKLWNNFHSKNKVVPMLKETLSDLQLEYVDLFLIHWPFGFKEDGALWPISEGKSAYSNVDYLETWEGMEECVNLGLAKSIGISNFNSEQIERLLQAAKIKPVINQIECNPNINQKKLIQFCKERDIIITAYCPLGRTEIAGTPGFPEPTIYDPKVIEMAKKYNRSPAQVVLNYLVSLGVSIVPKSVTKSRIQENLNVFDFQLHDDDVAYLDSCNKNQRVCPLTSFSDHPLYPFHLEF